MDRWRIACAVTGLLISIDVVCSASTPSASLSISGDAVQPAGEPVMVQLLIRNTGTKAMPYWCSGPGEYPDASDFSATLVNADGQVQKITLANGQNPGADGRQMELAAGRSVQFAVTMGIVQPGSYQLSIESAAQISGPLGILTWPAMRSAGVFHIEVRHENELAAKRDARIVAGVRAGDPFARFVASTWRRRAVREALVDDLISEDIVAADRAADGLWGRDDPSKVDGPLLTEAILKHLKAPPGECDVGLMTRLTGGFEALDSDQIKAALTQLMLARPEGAVRRAAAAALDRQLDPAATTKRLQLAQAPDQTEVQRRLHDAAMLGAMLELARSEDVHERKLAYQALSDFANKPEAVEAIRLGLNDPDRDCQAVARKVWIGIVNHIATSQPK